jgi:hypothetical protein
VAHLLRWQAPPVSVIERINLGVPLLGLQLVLGFHTYSALQVLAVRKVRSAEARFAFATLLVAVASAFAPPAWASLQAQAGSV